MAFTRKALAGLGLTDEMVEKVMTLHGTSMADFIPRSELNAKISEAVAEAQKNAPAPNIKDSDDYKALQSEFETFKRKAEAAKELKKNGVKDKFTDNVFQLLEADKPIEEQLATIREQYEEYFDGKPAAEAAPAPAPQFGADVKGKMPTGKAAPSFMDMWQYLPSQKG